MEFERSMGGISYKLTMYLVNVVKAVELFFIKVFQSRFERICTRGYRKGGIILNGTNPWDIQVKDKEFYTRVVNQGSLGIGESYVEGMWDAEDIVEITCRTMKNGIYKQYLNPWNRFLNFMECYFFNLQTKQQAWEVGQKHYDLGEAQ
jgi:cyclopropane-fatty-acyl-phospholipid synthase